MYLFLRTIDKRLGINEMINNLANLFIREPALTTYITMSPMQESIVGTLLRAARTHDTTIIPLWCDQVHVAVQKRIEWCLSHNESVPELYSGSNAISTYGLKKSIIPIKLSIESTKALDAAPQVCRPEFLRQLNQEELSIIGILHNSGCESGREFRLDFKDHKAMEIIESTSIITILMMAALLQQLGVVLHVLLELRLEANLGLTSRCKRQGL